MICDLKNKEYENNFDQAGCKRVAILRLLMNEKWLSYMSTPCNFLFLSFTRNDPVHQSQWLSPTGRRPYPHPQGTGWCTLIGQPQPELLPGDRPVAQTPVPSQPTPRTPG